MTNRKEMSGFFLSGEKFTQQLETLTAPDCPVSHVRLYHNGPEHTAELARTLAAAPSVTSLDIFELDADGGAEALGACLAASQHLASLEIQHLHGHKAATQLAAGLALSTSLIDLYLTGVDDRSLAVVLEAVARWPGAPRLRRLRLSKCRVGPMATAALVQALAAHGEALQRLELQSNSLKDAAEGQQLLSSAAFQSLPRLTDLDLSGNMLGPLSGAALGAFLARGPNDGGGGPARLCVSHNPLGDPGVVAMAAGVGANTGGLLHLEVRNAGVGNDGAAALASALEAAGSGTVGSGGSDSGLTLLDLGSNRIGGAGAAALLCAAVAPGCRLAKLRLERNALKGADLVLAAAAIGKDAALADCGGPDASATAPQQQPCAHPPHLEELELAHNELGSAGVSCVLRLIADCNRLSCLDVGHNAIDDDGAKHLAAFLAARPHMDSLLLNCNRIQNGGAQALMEAALEHPGLGMFKMEANKVADPALKSTLTELSLVRAAKRSQEVALLQQLHSAASTGDAEAGALLRVLPHTKHKLTQNGSVEDGEQAPSKHACRTSPTTPTAVSLLPAAFRGTAAFAPLGDSLSSRSRDLAGARFCFVGGGSNNGSDRNSDGCSLPATPRATELISRHTAPGAVAGNGPSAAGAAATSVALLAHKSLPKHMTAMTRSASGTSSVASGAGRRMCYKPLTAAQQKYFEDF